MALQVIKQVKTKKELFPKLHLSDKVNNKNSRATPPAAVPTSSDHPYSVANPEAGGPQTISTDETQPKSQEDDPDSDITDGYGELDQAEIKVHHEEIMKAS